MLVTPSDTRYPAIARRGWYLMCIGSLLILLCIIAVCRGAPATVAPFLVVSSLVMMALGAIMPDLVGPIEVGPKGIKGFLHAAPIAVEFRSEELTEAVAARPLPDFYRGTDHIPGNRGRYLPKQSSGVSDIMVFAARAVSNPRSRI
jgi:hypothetical protein